MLNVLFLCTGNSCRSQMAEGWTRQLKGKVIEPYSAGVEMHGLNSRAVQVIAEAGVDISRYGAKHVRELSGSAASEPKRTSMCRPRSDRGVIAIRIHTARRHSWQRPARYSDLSASIGSNAAARAAG
ncbi:MAG: hypothetical protein GX575_22970 [Candidatus Anammoximicrobium sp.]|nr:hypothetical protein [Candidatus Anammoximicrobium sp.]